MTTLNVRIEKKTKAAASKALADIGLDMSSAVNMFLRQVIVEKGLPFRPTKDPAKLRAEWDKEVADAIKRGKFYSAEDALKGL
jgi:DNA-damage-inducible protein J